MSIPLFKDFTQNIERYCVESVRVRSYSGPYFPAFGLNKDRITPYLSLFSPNAGKYGPEQLRILTQCVRNICIFAQ